MDDTRTTRERLRSHLDGNQPMREGMCLALLPLLGQYTHGRPRRPLGGPDGGRDIEALLDGRVCVWGAVGFKNGGGNDDSTRRDSEKKFRDDLDRALMELPQLKAFVFFTNVDLTPDRIENLKRYALSKGIEHVDVFDFELLRHILDSPEGLIARLQYLGIPMSPTEQLVLVGKFGSQMQNAITSRFDRVEKTLDQLETFLDHQKPICRLDLYVNLFQGITSKQMGQEGLLIGITGLDIRHKALLCLCVNHHEHKHAESQLVAYSHVWFGEEPKHVTMISQSISSRPDMLVSYGEIALTSFGRRISIADLTIVGIEVFCTVGLRDRVKSISIDANGYEMFQVMNSGHAEPVSLTAWPEALDFDPASREWVRLVPKQDRNLFFNPLKRSERYGPLTQVT